MINKQYTISILFTLLSFFSNGQSEQDNLSTFLKNKGELEKIDSLNQLAEQNIKSNPNKGFKYAKQALDISTKINSITGQHRSAINSAKSLREQKKYNESLNYYDLILNIYIKTNNKIGIAYYYNETGSVYKDFKKYEKALTNYRKSLSIYKEANDSKNQYLIYNNIANIYLNFKKKNFKIASEYFLLAYNEIKDENDNKEKATILSKIGGCYANWGNYKEALKYLEKARKIAKTNQYTSLEINISESIENIKFNIKNKAIFKTGYEEEIEKLQQQYITAIKEENVKVRKSNLTSLEEIESLSFKNQAKELKLIVLEGKLEQQQLNAKIKEQNIQLLNSENKLNKAALSKKNQKLKNQEIIIYLMVIGSLLLIIVVVLIFKGRQNKQKVKFKQEQMNSIINAQEEERVRFAQDIHDGIGQFFFALKLKISELDDDSIDENQKKKIYQNAMRIIDDLQQEIRNISFSIMPQILHYKGLIAALEDLTDKINKLAKVKVDLSAFQFNERLDSQTEVAIYRIIQELTNNILKHSKATYINIHFTKYKNELNIIVEDNGAGYNTMLLENSKGHGWRNIKSRVEMINGTINIETMPQREGTTAIINVPIL